MRIKPCQAQYKVGDMVLFKTSFPAIHLLEMFGHCKFNPRKIKPEEYVGEIMSCQKANGPLPPGYAVSTRYPLNGFFEFLLEPQIIRLATDEDIRRLKLSPIEGAGFLHKDSIMHRQHIVILTGAGISAESGIPTYRGEGGLWQDRNLAALSTAAALEENPATVLEFYNKMRLLVAGAIPNAAHKAIAALEEYHNVTVITQNVDDLHERAGSSHVIHLHGNLTQVTSSHNRLDSSCIEDYPLDVPIKVGDRAVDGSQLRPAVVLFDEYVDMSEATRVAREADVFVVIGTSLSLSGAKALCRCPRTDIPRYVINPDDVSENLPEGFIWLKDVATKGMATFLDEAKGGFRRFNQTQEERL